ncbi:hypothetical protein IFM89_024809 [Coptis chinensis]|uniref:Peptidase M16 N-terminal domain-containing protein n=1 Tax=Coptis chinensis TaxID=261450 RepID=A0A835HPN3_9MAGN|nr:hypothetical protein IFM89_024809 [Coptis chinensis]
MGMGFRNLNCDNIASIPIFLAGSTTYNNKIPTGSPLTTIAKVLLAATSTTCLSRSPSNAIGSMNTHLMYPTQATKGKEEERKTKENLQTHSLTQGLKFFKKAGKNKPIYQVLECTVEDVEEVKVLVKILPIFACTIMFNCCLAQLSTFSVEQAVTMDTKVGSLKVPPASLLVFPILFIIILAPLYDHLIIPFARKATKTEMGISHLQIGGYRVALQYLFLGSADLFTLAGLLEFFFTEAPARIRSLAMAQSWASLAMGYYLSSVLVLVVSSITGTSKNTPWLSGSNLNHYHLERFYWLMPSGSREAFSQKREKEPRLYVNTTVKLIETEEELIYNIRLEAHMEVHVGSIDEEDDEQGIAHMIEHVAFLGNKKREKLLGTGARSNAYTDFHHTAFTFRKQSE